jgi:hypothetical protein
MIIVPPQARENVSKFLSNLEDDLIELDVPVWKVALGGLFIVGLFWGSFFVFQKLTWWML